MVSIARRNLFHDKVRLGVTLLGITFSVVLIFNAGGMYIGFLIKASNLIDHAGADLWVTSRNLQNFDFALPIPESKIRKIRETRGVAGIEKLILAFSVVQLKGGITDSVEIIGYNPDSGIGGPWRMVVGHPRDVKYGPYLIVDETARPRLGGVKVGDTVKVLRRRFKVVGISREATPFISTPYIFMSYDNAKPYLFTPGATSYVLVKVRKGYPLEEVLRSLRRLEGVDVYTSSQLAWKTRYFWTVRTPIALGVGVTALLAFIVGMVIVGQTIYTATVERLREFGTLKAIGATNRQILGIIIEQAILTALMGYLLGLLLHLMSRAAYQAGGVTLASPWGLKIAMFFITQWMCLGASVLAIRKALSVDPVVVFKA